MTRRIAILAALLAVLGVAAITAGSGERITGATAQQPGDKSAGTKEIRAGLRHASAPVTLADENGLPPKALGDDNRVPRVGDVKYWLALDDFNGRYYVKTFRLRGASAGAEVWVATNLNFPTNDCRNDGVRNVITDGQITYLLNQFDQNIRPTDTAWFGEPATRTGKDAQLLAALPKAFPEGSNAYFNKAGRDVILVDNVRDDNYFDANNAHSLSYIAGFFTSAMGFYHDRNVMTIDAFDWVHRTGENPPHSPTADPCTSAPARPFLYEGVFAHEYQHLIHNDYDPDEVNWVNEGMSDLAEVLTGYADTSRHVNEKGFDSHTNAFLGWLSVANADWNPIPRPSGPENSLTVWGDQGDGEILGDYGHAFYFMTYLLKHGFGQDFFKAWHHGQLNGIDGLNAALAAAGSSDTFTKLYQDMAVSALADGYADQAGVAVVGPVPPARIKNNAADATIYFSPNAYATHGAPPWGSDYIPLGPGAALGQVVFNGDEQFVFASGPQWFEVGGYFAATDQKTYGSNADVSITHTANLAANSTLTFNHYYDSEDQWDFGFVQLSTDGGATWTSLACTGTTTSHDPGAIGPIVANLPGYTGTQGTAASPLAASCSLSGFTGPVLIAFRFMSDPSVEQTGWFVKDIKVNGATVDSVLANWNNQKFYDPAQLDYIVQFVGLSGSVSLYGDVTAATGVKVVRATLGAGHTYTLAAGEFAGYGQVVAIITGVPEAEDNGVYSPYSLLVAGVGECADGVCLP